MTTNRYLEGAYGPVHEEVTAHDLPITGTVPDWLDGRWSGFANGRRARVRSSNSASSEA